MPFFQLPNQSSTTRSLFRRASRIRSPTRPNRPFPLRGLDQLPGHRHEHGVQLHRREPGEQRLRHGQAAGVRVAELAAEDDERFPVDDKAGGAGGVRHQPRDLGRGRGGGLAGRQKRDQCRRERRRSHRHWRPILTRRQCLPRQPPPPWAGAGCAAGGGGRRVRRRSTHRTPRESRSRGWPRLGGRGSSMPAAASGRRVAAPTTPSGRRIAAPSAPLRRAAPSADDPASRPDGSARTRTAGRCA